MLKFKIYGIKYGNRLKVFNVLYLEIHKTAKVIIGSHFTFISGAGFNPLSRNIRGFISVRQNAQLTIGNNVGISSSCLWVSDFLKIGNNTKIGANCSIIDTDAHALDYIKRRKDDIRDIKRKGIEIGEDVFIGTSCIIMKGVIIGSRSIVAAGSVVVKDIPDDEMWGGNPAKFIKSVH
jgi:acetyltransferase-like isoleucine patch superfamily enzyme